VAIEVAEAIDSAIERDGKSATSRESLADGPTFYRRVYLDMLGRIPSATESRRDCRNDSPKHRRQVIRKLSQSAAFDQRMAKLLVKIWFPQTDIQPYRYLAADTRRWIAHCVANDRPLNQVAGDLIAVPYTGEAPSGITQASPNNPSIPRVLIAANQYRPEAMVSNVTGQFLGVDLSCAQCHDHPFERWTREQFWQTAAFFQRSPKPTPSGSFGQITIPETDRKVRAALFTGDSALPERSPAAGGDAGRRWFSKWVAGPENPYFARHTVNSFWNALTGTSLPAASATSPTPPQFANERRVQDLMTEALIASNFDIRFLIRCITLTRAYQRSSSVDPSASEADRVYRPARIRGLDGEQLFDSLYVASGKRLLRRDLDSAESLHRRQAFCEAMVLDPSRPNRSIAQALRLLNGELSTGLSDPKNNATVSGLSHASFLNESECVSALYWSVLSRPPTDKELSQLRDAGLMNDSLETRPQRYGKLFWLLVNTIEFNTNH